MCYEGQVGLNIWNCCEKNGVTECRRGGLHSAEAAAGKLTQTVALCSVAGFRQIRMTGDCKCSQTEHLDRSDTLGLRLNSDYEGRATLEGGADDLRLSAWRPLTRTKREIQTVERAKSPNVNSEVVRRRSYVHLELFNEDVAEFEYKPTAFDVAYRIIVVRKSIRRKQGEFVLFV